MKKLLEGRVCVLSGCGPGTGAAVAKAFADEGATLVLASRRAESSEPVAKAITDAGGKALVVTGDVTKPEDRAALVEKTTSAFGRIDVLVNNAFATGRVGNIEGLNIEKAWRAAYEVNVFATMALSEAVLAPMKQNGGGAIVMVGTLASRKRQPGLGGYGSSKAALLAATQSLAAEVGKYGIRVNTVVPSHIDGPNLAYGIAMEAKQRGITEQEVREGIIREGVLPHITTPDEVASAVLFFASPMASAITGQSLDVNCGQWFE